MENVRAQAQSRSQDVMQDPSQIGQYINRIARMNNRWLEPRLAQLGLAAAQLPVFGAIKTFGPLSQTELAALLHVEQPSMAQLLARMERDGLVTRIADPADGRRSRIHLTPEALSRSKPAQQVLEAGRQLWANALTLRELANLERLLAKIVTTMEGALQNESHTAHAMPELVRITPKKRPDTGPKA